MKETILTGCLYMKHVIMVGQELKRQIHLTKKPKNIHLKGHVEIVDLLIKNGAKINDSIGPITPLHDVFNFIN